MGTSTDPNSWRGGRDLIEVLRGLLATGDDEAVIALVQNLMTSHERELRSILEAARRRGTKNEGVSTAQLTFFLDELLKLAEQGAGVADDKLQEVTRQDVPMLPEQETKPRSPRPRRRPIPARLEHVRNEIAVPEAERLCPVCGTERVCIGHEVTKVIDIVPARAIVREDRREKLLCQACEGQVVVAPLGDKVIEGGAYGSRLVADLVVGKYDDGLPLYRQHEQLMRLGLDMPTSSMGDQITWATELLTPIARGLFDEVLGSGTMHIDGTSLPVLDRDAPTGMRMGALWGCVGIDVGSVDGVLCEERRAAYLYTSTGKKVAQRDGELGPEDVLELRRGRGQPYVVADAAGLFDAAFAKPGLVEVGCNMHARRYFAKALDGKDLRAALPIAAFKKLYDVEERIRDKPSGERLRIRRAESKPVYDELVSWCRARRQSEPPGSLLGKAVRYLTAHREALTRFLDDGTLPIDNGVVERLHRKPAVGRRNYLFAGSNAGAERAAVAYTVLGTCRLLGINPTEYLSDVLPRLARGISIARDLPALMPAAWARAGP